ncbi:hypothetical protein DICPUDRAFT_83872 [Dictyostelium purpureum]|uniref:KANL2-like probable zinc-finger domain-containing protein n=1 Tax=Dictyostelium purpureum TaxID=5786 RepID=F1A0W3_DICPU|nr:uncharacterized protein DICPUDRAFT_83872 [Dictyostelium purpureum]EGC30165.1 hypothetical protein DICPUDRAFT_83872 [Dictyostelium purpureum]|eukprot:XP_003293310.1 hypothetical protein DICPUDRAFT_83872 [Dictyostelium purpureum]
MNNDIIVDNNDSIKDNSLVDGKRLCGSSKKICSKRPMEGYRFCIKHILEDPTAPFRQCEFISLKSQKQCTNPVSAKEDDPRFCVSHKHIIETTKKRIKEMTENEEAFNTDESPKTKILKILDRHGLSKGKFHQEYKKTLKEREIQHQLNQNKIESERLEKEKQKQIIQENQEEKIEQLKLKLKQLQKENNEKQLILNNQNNNINNTEQNNSNNQNNNLLNSSFEQNINNQNNNNNNNQNNEDLINSDEENNFELFRAVEDGGLSQLCDEFDSDFYFASSSLVTDEEIIQRKKIYISKLILLYKKQYNRFKERLRILRRHYITSTTKSSLPSNNLEELIKKQQTIQNQLNFLQQQHQQLNNQEQSLQSIQSLQPLQKVEGKIKLCSFESCKMNSVLLSDYCFSHILFDKNQKLFSECTYQMPNGKKCRYPILKIQLPTLCREHLDIYETNNDIIKSLPKKQKQFIKQRIEIEKHYTPTFISWNQQTNQLHQSQQQIQQQINQSLQQINQQQPLQQINLQQQQPQQPQQQSIVNQQQQTTSIENLPQLQQPEIQQQIQQQLNQMLQQGNLNNSL